MLKLVRSFVVVCALAGCGAAPEVDDTPLDAGALHSERGHFTCEVTLQEGAFRRGSNNFHVSAWDAAGRPATITLVSATMPSHAHNAAPSELTRDGSAWRVSNLLLTMPGRWEINLSLASETGRRDDAVIFVTVH